MRSKATAFLASALTFALLLSGCSPAATDYEQVSEQDKIVIRFSHVVGEDTPKGQAVRMFARLMKERTNGKVEVQVFSNSSLYKDSEELKALNEGRVQMIAPALSKLTGMVPELGVFDLPYLYPDLNGYHQVFDGKIGTLLSESVAKHHMVPLSFWDSGLKQFTTNVRPIRTPNDLRGSKMRIMPSSILGQQYSLLQVQAVQTDFNDVFSALQQGHIQGQENTISNIYSKKFYQVQRYITLSDHGYLGYLVLIDQKFWNRLPDDVRRTVQDTMQEVTRWQRQQSVMIEQDQLRQIEHCNCIQLNKLSTEDKLEWRHYFQPLYTQMEKRLGSELFQQLQLPNR